MPDLDVSLDFPFAFGEPAVGALLKSDNQHFFVDEQLGFSPEAVGEHLLLHVESNGENTQWFADQLAQALGVSKTDVGFCGLKDRNAITRQWFSVYDPKRTATEKVDAAFASLSASRLLEATRGKSKLRRGDHAGNAFVITLVLDDGTEAAALADLEQRLAQVAQQGVPNYFGLQRFGRKGNNLVAFEQWLVQSQARAATAKRGRGPRKPKGIILSSARSFLFNAVLSQRVLSGSWATLIDGDVSLDGLPSAPLWGRGRSATQGEALALERAALMPFCRWSNALEHLGLQQERRALVCRPRNLRWKRTELVLTLTFDLPPGQYATGVLRELCLCREPSREIIGA
ncbi:MAG TPA: tRNA pseudouridine(13) synthase TruD [Marinagarivorans sp.]